MCSCGFVATLTLGSQPRQGFIRAQAKRKPGSVGECEDEHSHSQMNSHFESCSPSGLLNLQRAIAGVKPHRIEKFFISLKIY
jgi:hypothetical protein